MSFFLELPTEFPRQRPILRFNAKVSHPLVDVSTGQYIQNHPKLINWSVHENLAQLVQDIIAQFVANPPVPKGGYSGGGGSAYGRAQQAQYGWGHGAVTQPPAARHGSSWEQRAQAQAQGYRAPLQPGGRSQQPPGYSPHSAHSQPGSKPEPLTHQRVTSLNEAMAKPAASKHRLSEDMQVQLIELAEEDIRAISNSRERQLDLIVDNGVLMGYNSLRDSTRDGLIAAAEENQKQQEQTEQLMSRLLSFRGDVGKLQNELQGLNQRQHQVMQRFSVAAVRAALDKAIESADERCGEIVGDLESGKIDPKKDLNNFTRQYIDAKKLLHLRLIKQERLNEAMGPPG